MSTVNNDEDLDSALARIDEILREMPGDFDSLTPELSEELDRLSDDVWEYEQAHNTD